MQRYRPLFLPGIALAMCIVFVVWLLWPDGLITVDFKDAPFGRVLAEVQRQGRVPLASNVPPETPVTLQLVKVPLMEALETLATRVEGDVRAYCLMAPSKTQLAAGIAEIKGGKPSADWKMSWYPGGPGAFFAETPPDPRLLRVRFEPMPDNSLQAGLGQVAQKTGILMASPTTWNPAIGAKLSEATANKLLGSMAAAVKGQSDQGFLIYVRERREDRGQEAEGGEGPGWRRATRSEDVNPAWIASRAEAAIEQLPPAQRTAAKAEMESMQSMMKEIRELPEDQRRAKMAEIMRSPAMQERMEAMASARDARRTPEQRAKRYKRYVERKFQNIKNRQ